MYRQLHIPSLFRSISGSVSLQTMTASRPFLTRWTCKRRWGKWRGQNWKSTRRRTTDCGCP
jgi:hypothetical protein